MQAEAWTSNMSFDAQDLARSAALEGVEDPAFVGEFVSVEYADEDRIATYLFESKLPGYRGWRWCVTVAQVDAQSAPTICDVVSIPGPESLIAPEWIAYRDRIKPEDVTPGAIIPSVHDDTRLVPGNSALPAEEELDPIESWDLGAARPRVLSIEGRDQASKRWYESDRGPRTPLAMSAPKPCQSCGFFIPITGALRGAFGVCANAVAPDDGRVVSTDHGCGAHSEATF